MDWIDKAMELAQKYAESLSDWDMEYERGWEAGREEAFEKAHDAARASLRAHLEQMQVQAVAAQTEEVADEGTPIDPREPRLHTDDVDVLPEGHPLAREDVYCDACPEMLHAFNNECMQTWVEMPGRGNFCLRCYAKAGGYPWPRDGSEEE